MVSFPSNAGGTLVGFFGSEGAKGGGDQVGRGGANILRRLPAQHGALPGARSHDPEIMT